MQKHLSNQILALLLVAEVLTVLIPFFILGSVFEFPDILRQPAEKAFTLFQKNQSIIVLTYYIFLISGLLFLPLAALLKNQFRENTPNKSFLELMYSFGVATAVFQAIGFCRWVFVMPFLTEQYFNNPNQANVILLYEMMNRYAGMTIGEHLGFLMMGFWLMSLAIALPFGKWFKYSGILIGILLVLSIGEHFGGNFAPVFASMNIWANVCWTLWMFALAFLLFKFSDKTYSFPNVLHKV